MNLDITTQERPTVHYLGIPRSARLSEFGAPDGPNETIPRVYQYLGERGIVPSGGPLYVFRRLGAPGEPVDLTVAVPIGAPTAPEDEMVLGSLPAGTYVVGRHEGAPDGIPESYAVVRRWAEEHGHRLDVVTDERGETWSGHAEHFLTDPQEHPDPSTWVTELLFKTV